MVATSTLRMHVDTILNFIIFCITSCDSLCYWLYVLGLHVAAEPNEGLDTGAGFVYSKVSALPGQSVDEAAAPHSGRKLHTKSSSQRICSMDGKSS